LTIWQRFSIRLIVAKRRIAINGSAIADHLRAVDLASIANADGQEGNFPAALLWSVLEHLTPSTRGFG